MAEHRVTFAEASQPVVVQTGTLLTEAARLAGVEIGQPCGGQGRCGRCMVQVTDGAVRRRSTLRLTSTDIEQGFALACQSAVEGDVSVAVPPQEKIERRLTTDRTAAKVTVPAGYDYHRNQSIRRLTLTLKPPSMDDQTDDWSRLQTALRQQAGIVANGQPPLRISLDLLKQIGPVLREADWQVTAILDQPTWREPVEAARLVALRAGHVSDDAPLWGVAIDIGTTTVSLWLVDLISGEAKIQVAEYNGQISRGEDVISRIIYASKDQNRSDEMRQLVMGTINDLIERACGRAKADPGEVVKATIAGNSTMMHLLLGIPAESIRLMPFVTVLNHAPVFLARDLGLAIHPEASVDCLPGVASYVGADISAGVLSSGLDDSDQVSLFLDIGTNGETVLGSQEWLVTCACSAGPAFEGAGVLDGMRATRGAIEEVWINGQTYEPTYRVIGGGKPRGVCGSGLISLLAELFLNGLLDKAGNLNTSLPTRRVRQGDHGAEYVIAWADETQHGRDIVITHVDVDNLLRAKAAIYAGFTVLADGVGFPLEGVERVLIGGAFGKYINVEKAVEIGLLPDMPWDRFHFLGNTSVRGAYMALLDQKARARVEDIAGRMTYIELSADNSFYDAFTSALFLPHTDLSRFPSVVAELQQATNPEEATAKAGD
ncbi:MAG: ASKHA domain-containing protein [Candidatus Promineifilaceae bacterium]